MNLRAHHIRKHAWNVFTAALFISAFALGSFFSFFSQVRAQNVPPGFAPQTTVSNGVSATTQVNPDGSSLTVTVTGVERHGRSIIFDLAWSVPANNNDPQGVTVLGTRSPSTPSGQANVWTFALPSPLEDSQNGAIDAGEAVYKITGDDGTSTEQFANGFFQNIVTPGGGSLGQQPNGLITSYQLSADGKTVTFSITGTHTGGKDVAFSIFYTDGSNQNYQGGTVALGTRSHTAAATQADTWSFTLPSPIVDTNNVAVAPNDISYTLIGDDGTSLGAQTYLVGNFSGAGGGQAPAAPTVLTQAQSGFAATFDPGTRDTSGTFNGSLTLVPSGAVTVNAVLLWGEGQNNLSNQGTIPSLTGAPYTLTALTKFPFSIALLDSTKTYYYALAKSGDPNSRYTDVQTIAPGGGTPAKAVVPTPGSSSVSPIIDTTPSQAGGLVPCDGRVQYGRCGWKQVVELINKVMTYIIFITVPIAACVFAYAGFLFLTKGGSEEARSKAKHIFLNVVIGLLFILASVLIVQTILIALGVTSDYRSLIQL